MAHFSEQSVATATALTMAGSERDGAATLLQSSVFGASRSAALLLESGGTILA
jgi:hypothetical protein